MTTFQDLPPQSRRAVRQSERDGDANAAVTSAPLNLAQTFLPTPDAEQSSPQAPPATGRRSRVAPQSGLVDMPTSPPAGYNPEPLNYVTQGAPGSQQPGPQQPGAQHTGPLSPASPHATGEQPSFRVRDFSPEARRAAPAAAPQPGAAPLDYRTQAAPVPTGEPSAEPSAAGQPAAVSPTATQPPAAPTAAPAAAPSTPAPQGPPMSRRELRAREAEALAASGVFSGVVPVPELVEPVVTPPSNLSNAMAEFEALTRTAQPEVVSPESEQASESEAASDLAAERSNSTDAPAHDSESQEATAANGATESAAQETATSEAAEHEAAQHAAEQAQAEQARAEQARAELANARVADANELHAQAQEAQAQEAQTLEAQAREAEARAAEQQSLAAEQQAQAEQRAQAEAQARADAQAAHEAEQQRARDAALAAQATAQAEANARAAEDERQQAELLAERKREYEAEQAERARDVQAPANPFDALFAAPSSAVPGAAVPAAVDPLNVPFVSPEIEQTGSHATSTGHWSRQAALDDETQSIENTLSREVGMGNVATTTSALVLPIIPQDSDFGSVLNGTGEVLITGSIDLPRSLSSTGGDARRYDDPDVDNLFDAFDNEIISTDSAPVRAIRAVSTHTSTHGVVTTASKPRGNRLLIGVAIGAVVLAIAVVGLLVFVVTTLN